LPHLISSLLYVQVLKTTETEASYSDAKRIMLTDNNETETLGSFIIYLFGLCFFSVKLCRNSSFICTENSTKNSVN